MKIMELIELAEAFDGALETPCLILPRRPMGHGYVHVVVEKVPGYAHRLAYEAMVGPVPKGLDLDHLCRWRACMNWTHLEPVTRQVNVLRGVGIAAMRAKQTHCVNGHPLSGENLYINATSGGRTCRECGRRATLAYYRNKRKANK